MTLRSQFHPRRTVMFRHSILAPLTSLSLVACSGGSVVVELTDAPPDVGAIDHVYITLSEVEAHVVDKGDDSDGDPKNRDIDKDNKWQTVTARAGEIDLVALQNDVRRELGELELPDGKITQIRLHIDTSGRNAVVLKSGEECPLDTSGVDPTGIKINHPFKALDPEGGRMHVVVDFDLKESVDQAGECSFSLKPVIKIKTTELE
jgi:hypothetical protein